MLAPIAQAAGAYGNCKPQSPLALRERLRKAQNSSLDARVLRRSRFFGELLIVWRLIFWCAYGTETPPSAYFSPTKLVRQDLSSLFLRKFIAKANWGLNKTAGIDAVPTMHPAEGKASIRTRLPE